MSEARRPERDKHGSPGAGCVFREITDRARLEPGEAGGGGKHRGGGGGIGGRRLRVFAGHDSVSRSVDGGGGNGEEVARRHENTRPVNGIDCRPQYPPESTAVAVPVGFGAGGGLELKDTRAPLGVTSSGGG